MRYVYYATYECSHTFGLFLFRMSANNEVDSDEPDVENNKRKKKVNRMETLVLSINLISDQ